MADHQGNTILSVKNLHVRIPNGSNSIEVLKGIDLSLARGEILGLVGASGAGKSILAKTLVRLEAPAFLDQGQILLDGQEISSMAEVEMARLRGKRISMVPQDPLTALDPLFTIKSHLLEVSAIGKEKKSGSAQKNGCPPFLQGAVKLLQTVGIASAGDRCRQYPHQWSRGMLQRGQLVMAFLSFPSVLVLDEVTSALDPTVCLQILDTITKLRSEHKTAILLVTHDIYLAAQICDRLAVIERGRIVEEGPVTGILQQPEHPYTQSLMAAALENGGTP